MAGPNFIGADQGFLNKGAGAAIVFEFKGGKFAAQIGAPQTIMRNGNNFATQPDRVRQANSLVWYKGSLYWCSGREQVGGLGSLTVMRFSPALDDWVTVFDFIIGSTSGNDHYGSGIFVVESGGEQYLVAGARRSEFGTTHAPMFAYSSDGAAWSTFDPGTFGGACDNTSMGEGISHGGLLFGAASGAPASDHKRFTFDPVGGGFSTFALPVPTVTNGQGAFFKFDGRLFHISSTTGLDGYLSEFTFGAWARLEVGTGLLGATIAMSSVALTGHVPCAIVLDEDEVILFGSAAGGLRAYSLTLSGGSGSTLFCADVTGTYIPAALTPAVGIGVPDKYGLFNLGQGEDGFWYIAIATGDPDVLGVYSLMRVVPGGQLADAGVMGAGTATSMVTATMNEGQSRDSKGTLPLVKAFPRGTAPGPTGMIQSFRVDGDPLIALHGAVTGGPFTDGEAVTWTGGSGIVLSTGGVGVAELHLHTIVGVVPDGLLMTGGGSGATATCSTSSGNGQAHTVRMEYYSEANGTGLGAPSINAPSGVCTMVAGSGVNCTVSKGTGPNGTDEVVTEADGSGQIKSFEWDFLLDGVPASAEDNVKLQASRV